jgi:chorismate--pyruvate lyase
MSAQNTQLKQAVNWLSEPAETGAALTPVLHGWLTDPGLLTARLRKLCGDRFQLQVLEETITQQGDMQRRIVLSCGDQACIYAETQLPASTIDANPWLRDLGNDPLGETLQNRAEVRRDSFEYALLTPEQLPPQIPVNVDTALWARRYAFNKGATALTVTEFFLSGVIDCAHSQMHTTDE